jgi:hypothetical protein
MLADRGESLGRKPSMAESECAGAFAPEVGHEADGPAGSLLAELVDAGRGNEEDRAWPDGKLLVSDALLAAAAQVEQQLPVGVPVRRVAVEGLEVAVDAQRTHCPVTAPQVKPAQDDGLDGRFQHQHNK